MKMNFGHYANLLTVLGAVLAGFFWLDNKLDSYIDDKFIHNQRLLTGLALSQIGQDDRAIEEFEEVLRLVNIEKLTKSEQISIIDPLLYSIAYSTYPGENEAIFKKALQIVFENLSLNGERAKNIGITYLFTGDTAKSKEYLEKCLKLFKAKNRLTEAAECYWGLSQLSIAEGEIEQAYDHQVSAFVLDPTSNLSPDNIILDKDLYLEQWWLEQLIGLYEPLFENYVNDYFAFINEKNSKEDTKIEVK